MGTKLNGRAVVRQQTTICRENPISQTAGSWFNSSRSRQLTASDIAVYVEIVWQPGKTGKSKEGR